MGASCEAYLKEKNVDCAVVERVRKTCLEYLKKTHIEFLRRFIEEKKIIPIVVHLITEVNYTNFYSLLIQSMLFIQKKEMIFLI